MCAIGSDRDRGLALTGGRSEGPNKEERRKEGLRMGGREGGLEKEGAGALTGGADNRCGAI